MSFSPSTLGQQVRTGNLLVNTQRELQTSQNQVSTGKKSELYSGLDATSRFRSVSYRQEETVVDSYVDSVQRLQTGQRIQEQALLEIAKTARDTIASVLKYPRTGQPPTAVINSEAAQALDRVQTLLNSVDPGTNRYLFSGSLSATEAVSNPATLDAATAAEITAYLGGTPAATVLTNITAFAGTNLGYDVTLAGAGNVVATIDTNETLDYTILADNPAFADIIRGLSLLEQIQYTQPLEAEFYQLIDGALGYLQTGALAVDQVTGVLGSEQKFLEEKLEKHSETKDIYNEFLSEAEDVDAAEAITRFENLQVQLQLIYQTITSLRDLSLANFI